MPKAKRRKKGEGSIFRRKDGRWAGYIQVGYAPDGKLVRKWVYGRTSEEVAQKLLEIRLQQKQGLIRPPSDVLVAYWAMAWLEQKAKEGVKPRTLFLYTQELQYALPELKDAPYLSPFGRLRITDVRPYHIQAIMDGLAERGLSVRTRKKVFHTLKAMFEEAVRLELIPKNPVASLRPPKGNNNSPKAGRTLEPWEVKKLLEAAKEEPLGFFFRLLLGTGLRKGEALGLKWGDIDLEKGEIRVERSWAKLRGSGAFSDPKTAKARRTVPLPPSLLEELKDKWAEVMKKHPPEAAKELWLFPRENGQGPVHPDTPNRVLKRLIKASGIRPCRIHDLRHTWGSIALANGVPLEVVSEVLGHASADITLRVYRHVLEEERRKHRFDLLARVEEAEPPHQA